MVLNLNSFRYKPDEFYDKIGINDYFRAESLDQVGKSVRKNLISFQILPSTDHSLDPCPLLFFNINSVELKIQIIFIIDGFEKFFPASWHKKHIKIPMMIEKEFTKIQFFMLVEMYFSNHIELRLQAIWKGWLKYLIPVLLAQIIPGIISSWIMLKDQDNFEDIVEANVDLFNLFLWYQSTFVKIHLSTQFNQLVLCDFSIKEVGFIVPKYCQLS